MLTQKLWDKEIRLQVRGGRVAIAGLGGLGSHIAIALARCGVGQLHLLDFDRVDESNLGRQCYNRNHLGKFKTEALAEQLLAIDADLQVRTDTLRVTEENLSELFKEDDIICEAFDRAETKAMFVNGILEKFPEKILIAGSGMAGDCSSNLIRTRRIMKNFYLCGDGENGLEAGMKLLAPRVSICAGHMSNMVMRLLCGETEV